MRRAGEQGRAVAAWCGGCSHGDILEVRWVSTLVGETRAVRERRKENNASSGFLALVRR